MDGITISIYRGWSNPEKYAKAIPGYPNLKYGYFQNSFPYDINHHLFGVFCGQKKHRKHGGCELFPSFSELEDVRTLDIVFVE